MLPFVWNFYDKLMITIYLLIFFGTRNSDFVIKTRGIFSFVAIRNKCATIRLYFVSFRISTIVSSNAINFLSFDLYCIHQYFHKYFLYHWNISQKL